LDRRGNGISEDVHMRSVAVRHIAEPRLDILAEGAVDGNAPLDDDRLIAKMLRHHKVAGVESVVQ
jgi:hypothetical protein